MPEDDNGTPITHDQIDYRFTLVQQKSLRSVALWRMTSDMDVASYWWMKLRQFLYNP